uniref:Uncharacterized protein n=1 Tax=Glossina brevipalpis TaxID=37001 RepID=A0A1A9W3Z1_9MUSC
MELTAEPSIFRILVNAIKGNEETKNITKYETSNDISINQKITRNIHENNASQTKNYYEEQMPVVVYSKTDADFQDNESNFKHQNTQEYDNDYASQYYDDNDTDTDNDGFSENEEKGRSSHYNDYDMYYNQFRFTTLSPQISTKAQELKNNQGNKNKLMRYNEITRNRNPSSQLLYADYYDYYDRQSDTKTNMYPVANIMSKQPTESTWVSVLKTLKTLLDLYKSFITVWNSLTEQQHKEQQELKKEQKQTQQKIRINSKKPSNFGINKNNKQQQNKVNDKTTIQKGTDDIALQAKEPLAKVEPRKEKGLKGDVENLSKRSYGTKDKENEVEARYIKGDPLKGYYDFVITEGSYKFWAVFQVGTALLIIYSTFAAIYYSKVNPLVSDYDYVDYLGGGRSLSAVSNLDFVDNKDYDDDQKILSSTTATWYNGLITQTVRTVKFILQAIDKLPADEQVELKGKEQIKATTTLPYYQDNSEHF